MCNILFCGFAKRASTTYSTITCCYMGLLVILLIYLNYVYQIGKYNLYSLPLLLILAEVFKYGIVAAINSKDIKGSKTRKHVIRIKIKEIFINILIIFIMTLIYYMVSILFGAPFLSDKEETFMFSVLLTCLTVIPACLHLGSDATIDMLTNLTSFKGDPIWEMILRNVQITLVGAWLGAIVIPLDWDRPWQIWPIPCSLGAIIGNIFANVVNLVLLNK